MGQGTTAIIHDMWETVTGNAADLRAEADNLDVAMEEEAMMLTPMDAKSIQDIFDEFEKKLKEYKKKEQAKKSVAPKKK